MTTGLWQSCSLVAMKFDHKQESLSGALCLEDKDMQRIIEAHLKVMEYVVLSNDEHIKTSKILEATIKEANITKEEEVFFLGFIMGTVMGGASIASGFAQAARASGSLDIMKKTSKTIN